jgi:uncharacterized protein (DUF1800 family)
MIISVYYLPKETQQHPQVLGWPTAFMMNTEAIDALPPLAVIALNRLAFGPAPGDPYTSFDAFHALGGDDASCLAAYVDQQLAPDFGNDPLLIGRLGAAAGLLPSLTLTVPQLWSTYYLASGADRTRPVRDIRVATLLRAIYSRWQLFEVMADFWHNHFSIYAWDYAYASATWVQYDRDVIRVHALGNFRQLLEAIAQSTAMLYYLDNYINQDSGPNENYARELFELHALGAENYLGTMPQTQVPGFSTGQPAGYVDDDVYGAAACFTGWRVNNGGSGTAANDGTFQYYDPWHYSYLKLVLSRFILPYQAPMQDGRDVLDTLAAHPGAARFICRKLIRRLIGDQPPQSLVDAAATEFLNRRNDPDQIKQVVRFIALSNEFRNTWKEKIKRPHEFLYSALRAVPTNVLVDSGGLSSLWGGFDAIGQQLFGRRPPDGYPDVREAWTNTTSLLYRWRLANNLLENSYYSSSTGTGVQTDLSGIDMSGAVTPNAIADFWTYRILGRAMEDPVHRAEVVRILQGWSSPAPAVTPVYGPDQPMTATDINNRLRRMVALVLMSPEFQER